MKAITGVLISVLTLSICSCSRLSTKAPYKEVLEEGLIGQVETTAFPTGEVQIMTGFSQIEPADISAMKFHSDYLAFLEKARDLELIRLSERRQGTWSALLSPGIRFFNVQPTDKLLRLADKSKSDDKWIRVVVGRCEITEIIKDTDYKNANAPQGEEYRLILGKFMNIPTKEAAELSSLGVTTDKKELKFRAVLKVNPFNKSYSFVVADYGYLDREDWITSYVK